MHDLENLRKKLIFRSEHRGTKEMDLLMGSFARKYVPGFEAGELAAYEELLKENDPNLYNWITGKDDAPANVRGDVFERLKNHQYSYTSSS